MRCRLASVVVACIALLTATPMFVGCTPEPPDLAARWPLASVEPTVSIPAELQRWPLTGRHSSARTLVRPRVVAVALGAPAAGMSAQGLSDADVVYELADSGVGQLLALFQSSSPGKAGPVRPARLADVDVASQYRALLAHAGGTADVLAAITTARVADLDASANRAAFATEGSASSVFTSIGALRHAAARRRYPASADVRPFTFRALPARSITTGTAVRSVTVPSGSSAVTWTWDGAARVWRRGAEATATPPAGAVGPANVVVLWTRLVPANGHETTDSPPAGSPMLALVGSGRATVFRDGTRVNGSWEASRDSPPVIRTSEGAPIPFAAGQTWFVVIPNDAVITLR